MLVNRYLLRCTYYIFIIIICQKTIDLRKHVYKPNICGEIPLKNNKQLFHQ